MQVMVLEGGVKGWVKAGPEFTQLMDGFKSDYWKDLFEQEGEKDKEKRDAGLEDQTSAPEQLEESEHSTSSPEKKRRIEE